MTTTFSQTFKTTLQQNYLKKIIADIFINVIAYWLALKARSLGVCATVITFLMISYALSPIDLIPDVIPILGYLDELLIIPMLIGLIRIVTPPPITEKYQILATNYLNTQNKPQFKLGLITVSVTWILLGYLALSILY